MTTGAYSFLDIAVSDGARHHFAVGDPLILLSADLRTLVWVNGPGAILLGFDNIEDALSSPLKLGENVRRQIRATLGFPALETPRALTIRLNSGLQSAPLNCSAGKIVLPDGNDGILLAVANGAPPDWMKPGSPRARFQVSTRRAVAPRLLTPVAISSPPAADFPATRFHLTPCERLFGKRQASGVVLSDA